MGIVILNSQINRRPNHIMKKLSSSLLLLSLIALSPTLIAKADPYSSAFGPQATMSPATTSLSLSGNGGIPQAATPSSYTPGNGVYLSGQPAIVSSSPMAQGMPVSAQPMAMQAPVANPYYGAAPAAQAPNYGYGSPYPGSPMEQMGYSAGGNTYTTTKPQYGQPSHMVQRNSASYVDNNSFPYRNNPSVVLNPNSMTGVGGQNAQNINPGVLGILNRSNNNQQNGQTTQNGGGMAGWMQKVFHREPGQAQAPKASRW